eukprot:4741329-Prorocentrum_lima.AAC.1
MGPDLTETILQSVGMPAAARTAMTPYRLMYNDVLHEGGETWRKVRVTWAAAGEGLECLLEGAAYVDPTAV